MKALGQKIVALKLFCLINKNNYKVQFCKIKKGSHIFKYVTLFLINNFITAPSAPISKLYFIMNLATSSILTEKAHSLSYQEQTLTILPPITFV